MENCPPAALLGALGEVLSGQFAARDVDLFVVDYGLRCLQPVSRGGGPTPPLMAVDGTVAGRTFTSGRVTTGGVDHAGGVLAHVPVMVRGDRLGVLRMWLPAPPDGAAREELAGLGVVVGHALAAANRDTDLFDLAAREQRLSLGAEMQRQLLPGRFCAGDQFTLSGQLEPAYGVRGDNFDWSCASDHLQLTVSDGMGEGTKASMLTHLGVTALRNARRAGCDLADQACLADQAIFAHRRGSAYLATLLMRFDFDAGRAWAVDAGSPILFRQRGTELEKVDFDHQLPLGMFDGTQYVAQEFPIARGDRLLVVTDGVHDATPRPPEKFGETALPHIAAAARGLPVNEAVRQITHQFRARHEGAPLADDAVVVCLDWNGPGVNRLGEAPDTGRRRDPSPGRIGAPRPVTPRPLNPGIRGWSARATLVAASAATQRSPR